MAMFMLFAMTLGLHCDCCESKLTTAAILHKGATYKLFKVTFKDYRWRGVSTQKTLSVEYSFNKVLSRC